MITMEEGLQQVLDAIFAKEISELTENDKGILRARADVIGRNNRKKYAEVLGQAPEPQAAQPQEEGNQEVVKDPNAYPGTQDDGVDE